jgi:hypothetical protein
VSRTPHEPATLPTTPTVAPDTGFDAWRAGFVREHGRPPRILHIGNIANNAYLNAKMLNAAGLDCDVIAYDYYHIMGCPEWEDAPFEGDVEDHFHPDWESVDLDGFERPRWFAQGPRHTCIEYLLARRRGDADEAERLWDELRNAAPKEAPPAEAWRRLGRRVRRKLDRARAAAAAQAARLRAARKGGGQAASVVGAGADAAPAGETVAPLCRRFRAAFPDRADQLESADLTPYQSVLPQWQALFEHYDLVIGYATDGALPLLCGKRPYIAFEHGTIRNIPFEATTQGRLCAATYRFADAAFITNCDNIKAAERLALANHRFVPHPVNEADDDDEGHAARCADLRESLRRELGCSFIVFHPSRQHWEPRRHPDWEKGNDVLIRGLAEFIAGSGAPAGAVFVEWGQKVEESKRLLETLGIADRVKWIPPQPNRRMIRYVEAADVVADQFYLGAFGSLTPKALLHGCPVMLHLDVERHRWCLPEMPPVINVNTPEGVRAGLERLHAEAGYRDRMVREGRAWYDRYHSNRVIVSTFGETIMSCLARAGGTVGAGDA